MNDFKKPKLAIAEDEYAQLISEYIKKVLMTV